MSFCIILGGLLVTILKLYLQLLTTHKNKSGYQVIMAKLYFFFMNHQTREHPIQVFFLATSLMLVQHPLIFWLFLNDKLLKILLRFNNTNGGSSELSVPESNRN